MLNYFYVQYILIEELIITEVVCILWGGGGEKFSQLSRKFCIPSSPPTNSI